MVTARLPLRGLARRGGQHLPGLSHDDENSRLAEAAWAVYSLGANTVVVEDLLASGTSSRVWRLAGYGPGGCTRYVVKWFRPRWRQAGRAVATEYAALTRLGTALAGVPAEAVVIGCAAPVQVWDWGYAMTEVPGVRLDQAVTRDLLPAADLPALATGLVTALRAYHAAGGGRYGDFEPGNVLLAGPREAYLLAPGPTDAGPPPTCPALAADVACWIEAAAISAVAPAVRRRRNAAASVQLAGELARAAVDGGRDSALAGEIDRCLAGRWDQLRREGPYYRAVVAVARRVLLRGFEPGTPGAPQAQV